MRHILLLRGINLGARRRVPMAQLRELLSDAGFGEVRTYVQSGNVVLDSDLEAAEVAARAQRSIGARFGFEVPVLARSYPELAAVVRHDPHGDIADEPKLYQVTFLAEPISAAARDRLRGLAVDDERFAAHGRELYSWHPAGAARSKLWNALAGDLGVAASARNWRTVTTLLQMAAGE